MWSRRRDARAHGRARARVLDGVTRASGRKPFCSGRGSGCCTRSTPTISRRSAGSRYATVTLPPSGYALRWAFGHAAAIGLIAAAVLGFGLTRALDLSRYAELLVCAALLAIGTRRCRRAALREQAEAVREHAAAPGARPSAFPRRPWHEHSRGGGTSVLMGLLHGGAGSAAVLALLPLDAVRERHRKRALSRVLLARCGLRRTLVRRCIRLPRASVGDGRRSARGSIPSGRRRRRDHERRPVVL